MVIGFLTRARSLILIVAGMESEALQEEDAATVMPEDQLDELVRVSASFNIGSVLLNLT